MFFMTVWIIIPMIITALILVNFFLMKKSFSLKKISIYECGFSPKFSARLPFSLRFFLLALLFLIFDVELTMVILFPVFNCTKFSLFSMIVFCTFLFLGLLHEWNEGSLSWTK